MSTFHNLHVKNITKETANAVSIVFDIPDSLKETFSFQAGQYITIKKEINGQELRRAYSICSSPNQGELRVAVKSVENGTFSVFANEKIKEGDMLQVSAPEGRFILNPESGKEYIAFAAGSGITPVLSMIKAVLEDSKDSKITLIYGNRSQTDTIFKDQLEELHNQSKGRFKLHYVFSRENVSDSLFGRIDTAFTNYFVNNIYKDVVFDSAYLCGPEDMINTVSQTLQSNGMDESKILFELFSSSSESDTNSSLAEGETQVTVLLDDEEIQFSMKQTDTILAASLRNDVDAPYSCQGGICSSCLAKITTGKAVMDKNSILTDGEVEDGFVLTCQAHPTSSAIYVDFDDV